MGGGPTMAPAFRWPTRTSTAFGDVDRWSATQRGDDGRIAAHGDLTKHVPIDLRRNFWNHQWIRGSPDLITADRIAASKV